MFVGAHLGALALIVAAIALCIFLARRRRARREADDAQVRAVRVAALDRFVDGARRPRPKRLEPPR